MVAFTADLLTFSRLIAAGVLAWLGTQGEGSLPTAVGVGVSAWATDMLDGWAARHASTPTRLAPYDFAIDTALYGGTLAYLTLAGFLPRDPVLAFVAVSAAAGLAFRRKAVQIVFVRLIDLAAAVVVFTHEPVAGWLLVAWLAVMALIYRRRLAKRVPRFICELASLVGWGRRA